MTDIDHDDAPLGFGDTVRNAEHYLGPDKCHDDIARREPYTPVIARP
jgi:hypothetical protein